MTKKKRSRKLVFQFKASRFQNKKSKSKKNLTSRVLGQGFFKIIFKKTFQKSNGLVVSPKPSLTPVLAHQVPIPEVASPKTLGLTSLDLVRPGAALKRTLEAFFLDQRSPHTQRAYSKDFTRFVKYLLYRIDKRGPEALDRGLIVAYKDALLFEKLSETTVDRHLATLRSLFRGLAEDGFMEKNPAELVRFFKPNRLSTTQAFTDEEVVRLLDQPDLHSKVGALHYAVLMVLFYCGLRRSELCELKTSQITTERKHVVLRLRGKGNRERLMVLMPGVWNAIRYYFLLNRRDWDKGSSLFQPVRNNRFGKILKPLDSSQIYYIVTRYAKLAGIEKTVSPHSCRATAISNARDHQVSDRAIQEFAGWASPDMITRYDKRKTSIENSAAKSIRYRTDREEGSPEKTPPRDLPEGRIPDWDLQDSTRAAEGITANPADF